AAPVPVEVPMARRSPKVTRALAALVAAIVAILAVPALSASPASAAQSADPLADAADQALGYLGAWSLTRLDPARWDAFVGVDPELTALAAGVVDTRLALAQEGAARAGGPAEQLEAVWSQTSEQRLVAMYAALGQVGVPYHRNASSPGQAFDCSGLTAYAWGQAGVGLAHQSATQIQNSAR